MSNHFFTVKFFWGIPKEITEEIIILFLQPSYIPLDIIFYISREWVRDEEKVIVWSSRTIYKRKKIGKRRKSEE